jgi:hypothetical protein
MKTVLMGMTMIVLLASCNGMKGNLVTKRTIGLKTDSRRLISIKPGSYKANLTGSSKTKLRLTLTLNKKSFGFPFVIKSGTTLPSRKGQVVIKSSVSKQPYDLKAVVDTKDRSNIYDVFEQCISHYRYKRVCVNGQKVRNRKKVKKGKKGNNGKRRVCRDERVPVYGERDARYNAITSTKTVRISFLNKGAEFAKFNHNNVSTKRMLISAGACY